MPDASNQLGPGTVLADRYELTTLIGRGGFGHVYRARQLNMGRDVAIKVLPPEFMAIPDVVERFKREARLASRLQHPHTITLHDYGKHDNFLFIVMELLHGEDLADLLKREGRLAPAQIVRIAGQVLKSLSEAHQNQIIHRDLKPENIFLSVLGEDDEFVKVLDFGIAKLALPETNREVAEHRSLTMSGSTVGTPAYMSPEQAAGEELNGQSDLYALGIIMYEMATGRPPFHHKDAVKVMRAHLFEEIPPLPDPALRGTLLDRVIRKAVQRDKAKRFASAQEFLLALAGEPVAKPRVQGIDLSSLSEASSASRSGERPAAGFERDPSPTQPIEVDVSEDLRRPRAGASPEKSGDDAVPFGALAPDSPTAQEGPPTGFDKGFSSSSSSIITVLEAPVEPQEEEVILLTRPKETTPSSSPSSERQANVSASALEAVAPNTPAPVRATPRSGSVVHEGDGTPREEEWSWGDIPTVSAENSAEHSADALASAEVQPGGSSALVWVLTVLVLAAIIGGALFFLAPML